VLIYSLRQEARISGEASSFRLIEKVLAELGVEMQHASEPTGDASPVVAALRRFRHLERIARTMESDVLVVKIPTAAQLSFACLATRHFHGRVIFWIDGLLWNSLTSARQWRSFVFREPLLTGARFFFNHRIWTRLVRSRPLEIVVASQTQKAELEILLPHACIHVVPNGTASWSRRRQAQAKRDFAVGYIGHAYLVKGVWELLGAFRTVRENCPFIFRCALSGLGSPRFQRDAIRAGMEVFGEVERNTFYESIDLLIAPYRAAWGTQTFPNVLLEALSHGVPVLTTDLSICRELFPGNLAHFVPPGDASALAVVLEKIVRRELPLASPDQLRAHFNANYSRAHIAEGWRQILRGSGLAHSVAAHD